MVSIELEWNKSLCKWDMSTNESTINSILIGRIYLQDWHSLIFQAKQEYQYLLITTKKCHINVMIMSKMQKK